MFISCRWKTRTNPDLAFASAGLDRLQLDARTLEKFPRSQHRPSLIMAAKHLAPIPSEPYKRWNFRKANWNLHSLITKSFLRNYYLLTFAMLVMHTRTSAILYLPAAKISIPRIRNNNYRLYRDEKCER